ncbi:hypothetical protein FQN54_005255 [Arachnomyces sp. PD_36]|nr:hypothetical protein FQN54_005255 [Arachnomyces sp. PD_36]
MRGVQIFSGTSHPALAESICERLGTQPAKCELKKFSNGETSVNIGVSIRNQDVFIVQSGSPKINDSVMELLIMISACKGGSAKSITAVMPYFPYSRQSKKKSHRGAITARMLANLLSIAGVDHVITVDLHASQMQGFFGKPVDNLFAEPLIARWIRINVPGWREAVVVSKNAGGTKRVTSLADALKLNFGIVTTDRRRPKLNWSVAGSTIFFDSVEPTPHRDDVFDIQDDLRSIERLSSSAYPHPAMNSTFGPRPLTNTITSQPHLRPETPPAARRPSEEEAASEYTDERAREVITGRLVSGHIVDDDYTSPSVSMSASVSTLPGDRSNNDSYEAQDPMTSSYVSTISSFQADNAQGVSYDASDDEESAQQSGEDEKTITLVGHVKDKTVFIVDDMIDKCGSWIAAAETVVKKGGATKVYCIATHGLFDDESLEQMEQCECIDHIVITNSFPITQRAKESKKLVVLDLSTLISEGIRRHHYGESISALFQLHD